MAMRVEKISAVTFRVADMALSVRFYRDVLGTELLFGGEDAGFCSLRIKDVQSVILNLELGRAVTRWGRLIFYVADCRLYSAPGMRSRPGHTIHLQRAMMKQSNPAMFISSQTPLLQM
jgi:glyoxalase/bleomycin resistance protein/dioxygenase superfamily protein